MKKSSGNKKRNAPSVGPRSRAATSSEKVSCAPAAKKTPGKEIEEIKRLNHELRTHKIELEMQNEELRRAQVEIETSERKYADLYDFAPVGYFTFDRSGKMLDVNITGAAMLGVDRRQLLKESFYLFVEKEDLKAFGAHRQEVFRTGMAGSCEITLRPRKGEPFYAQLRSVCTGGVEEEICRTAVLDITERKRAEERLKQAVTHLERSNRELEQFAYVASHDLQEPLRMVTSYVQLLGDRYKDQLDEKANKYMNFVVGGAMRMHELIGDLLAYSRISQGNGFRRVDTGKVFDTALSRLSSVVMESGATVTKDNLPMVSGDEAQLLQLFENLIDNAIKFRRLDVPPALHFSAREQAAEWLFSIKDNGIGIEPAYFGRIFQIFQRLYTRERYPGTGLGLALCKRIVERHGGRIWVESTPGQGSIFFFTIPRKEGDG